ncbi:uncharacterized protein LOC121969118 [Zingiber officinale]|uniref:uncharacterized protein LOC121969118 n=1 Tax=Zingiber officinale TaxID=94328 RepID=UPI001C4B8958|nr:uncharacterized protein LOC121969118 [Zingiber officinale]
MSHFISNYDCLLSSDDELETIVTAFLIEDSLDDEEGSRSQIIPGKQRRVFIRRNLLEGHIRLFNDYFANPSVYPPNIFRRRFQMNRDLFLRILNNVENHEPYFVQRRNVAGTLGLSSLQKVTVALRILAYGVGADLMDEYVRIGETTAIKSMKLFVKAVISIFGDEYLRSPNSNGIARLLAVGEKRGFPGMLGSIDCMHWKWKNCPTAWRGMYTGHAHEPTIILEAVASYDLWIWHAFFGLPGSHNDINVLERSNIFTEITEGRAPKVNYSINGHDYTMGYYLADGIYPSWSTFVKTIPTPQGRKRQLFASTQESTRKDVERTFGVLQARFAIVCGPALYFCQSVLKDIMMACIILHNMIVEDERDSYLRAHNFDYDQEDDTNLEPISRYPTSQFVDFLQRHRGIRNKETHSQLQFDLIKHQWLLRGEE